MYTETVLASDSSTRLHVPKAHELELPQAEYAHDSSSQSRLNEAVVPVGSEAQTSFASGAGVAVRKSTDGLGVHSVLWRIIEDGHVLSLEPIDTNGEPAGYSPIRVRSGSAILPNFVQVTDHRGLAAVIDFFTTDGILYTVLVGYDQFSEQEFDTSQPWRVMKQPLAFDLVKPQVLHAVSDTTLLISLADGSLLKFTRKDPLGALESCQLEDQFAPSGFGWMFRGDDKVEGKPHLSKRSLIAIDSFEDLVVTYSVNNEIKLWSLANNRCVSRHQCSDKQAPLRLQARPYVKFDESGQHVAAYVPLGGQPGLEIYEIAGNELHAIHQTTEPGVEYASWMLTELLFSTRSESFQIVVAWQSNLSSVIKTVTLSRGKQYTVQSFVAVANEAKSLLSLPEEADLELFISSIFSFNHYSELALRRGLQVFDGASPLPGTSLEETARRAVQRAAHSAQDPGKQSLRLQWLRLDRICREVEAQSAELLGLGYVPSSDLVWVLRSGYVSLLTPVSQVSAALKEGVLADLFEDLPKQALHELHGAISRQITVPSDRLIIDGMEQVYNLLAQYDLSGVSTSNVNGLDELLSAQLSLLSSAASRTAPSPLTPLGAELVARIVTNSARDAQKLLVRLIAVLVIAVSQNQVHNGTALFASALEYFKSTMAILALREPVGSTAGRKHSPWVSGIEIGIASSQIKVDGEALAGLPQYLWPAVDVSHGSRGLSLFWDLAQENYAATDTVAQYLPQTAAGTFVKGLGLLRVDPSMGKELILKVAPAIALRHQPELAFLGADICGATGFSQTYLAISRLAESVGALDAALYFSKLAAQSPVAESQRQLQRLALAAGDLDCVYQVICTLHSLGDVQIKQSILLLLEAAAKQGKADHVVRNLPFIGMAEIVHEILTEQSEIGGVPAHKLLYVWCIAREDYVGAATAIYKSLAHTAGETGSGNVSEAVAARFDWYTILLNALKCANEQDRWMLVDNRVVTFKDVEQEYLSLLSTMTQSLPEAAASNVFKLMS